MVELCRGPWHSAISRGLIEHVLYISLGICISSRMGIQWLLRFFLEREADRVNYQSKSIPVSCQLVPSEMMLVPAGSWHCSAGRAGDSSSSSEGGGKGRTVFLCSRWRWRNNRCAGRLQWTGGPQPHAVAQGSGGEPRSSPELHRT